MKSSFITFASLFIFLIGAVVAAPTTLDSTEVAKRQSPPLDQILNECLVSVNQRSSAANATTTVTTTYVTSYCTDIVAIINVAITACGSIPSGSFLNITLIADILFQILCQINYTLQHLLFQCGLLGLLSILLTFIISLLGGLIPALFNLLAVVAGVCGPGLLGPGGALYILIVNNCGLGFLLLVLGLVI